MARGRIGSMLGKAGGFLGANVAAMLLFSLLGPSLDRMVQGSPEEGDGGGEGGLPPDILDALMRQQGGSSGMGTSAIEGMLQKRGLQDQLVGSQGAAYGSSFNMPNRMISPELMTLTDAYRDQIAGMSQQTPRGFAQLMAERGYY